MTTTYALIDKKNNIINTISWDGKSELTLEKGIVAVDCTDSYCMIGGVYKDGSFYPPKLPEKSKGDLIFQCENERSNLISYAQGRISILQYSIDTDMATEEEISLLKSLKRYVVLLSRIDTSLAPEIEFPVNPEG